MTSGNGQNGMMSALWGMGCEEGSEYHQVVGDGASGQGCGSSGDGEGRKR